MIACSDCDGWGRKHHRGSFANVECVTCGGTGKIFTPQEVLKCLLPREHIASTFEEEAISLLNTVKAWRDSDGNEGFPERLRLRIDAFLHHYEKNRSSL